MNAPQPSVTRSGRRYGQLPADTNMPPAHTDPVGQPRAIAQRHAQRLGPAPSTMAALELDSRWPTNIRPSCDRFFRNTPGFNHTYRKALLSALFHCPYFVSFVNLDHEMCPLQAGSQQCTMCCLKLLMTHYWTLPVPNPGPHNTLMALLSRFNTQFDAWLVAQPPGIWEVAMANPALNGDPVNFLEALVELEHRGDDLRRMPRAPFPALYQNHETLDMANALQALFGYTMTEEHVQSCGCRAHGQRSVGVEIELDVVGMAATRPLNAHLGLEALLDRYFEETVDGAANCPAHGRIERRTREILLEAPLILPITLQRFHNAPGGALAKVANPVKYPKTIDLVRYTSSQRKVEYELRAAICHRGNATTGNFVSYQIEPNGRHSVCSDRVHWSFARTNRKTQFPHTDYKIQTAVRPGSARMHMVTASFLGDATVLFYERK